MTYQVFLSEKAQWDLDVLSFFRAATNLAPIQERCYRICMTQLAKTLDKKLATWRPEVAAQVEQIVTEVMELADANAVDLVPSRAVVQEVLDTLDESQAE